MDASSRTQPRIWLGYSPRDERVAERLRLPLRRLPVTVQSDPDIPAGQEISTGRADLISRASGAVLLLSAEYFATQWEHDRAHLLARLETPSQRAERDRFWLILVVLRDCIWPRELMALPRCHRLPRSGTGLAALNSAEREAVPSELARLVAAQSGLAEPDDLHRSAVRSYREKLRKKLELLPLRDLAGFRHPEQARSPRMSALYVMPRLELLRPSRAVTEEWQELERQLDEPARSPEDRWRLSQRRQTLLDSLRQDEYLSPDVLLQRHPQALVYGRPGSGKSMLLRHLALQHTGDASAYLPVLVALADLLDRRSGEPLRSKLLRWLRRHHSEVLADAFCERMANGRALLLLDGLDEVAEAQRPDARRAVEEFLTGEPALRCVITSRLGPDCDLNESIPQLMIGDLDRVQIAEFIQRHTGGLSADLGTVLSGLLGPLAVSSPVAEFARNPLTLLILCRVYEERSGFPEQLVQLYESSLETLLRTWPASRGNNKLSIPADELRSVLAAVALWMQRRGLTRIAQRDLEQELAKSVPRRRQQRPEELARSYVRAFSQEAGLLLEPEPGRFEFLHLTFGEYLAAIQLLDESRESELVEHRGDTRWAQVTRFAAAVLTQLRSEPERAGQLMLALAEEHPGTVVALQHPHLPLVAECLGDGSGFPAPLVATIRLQILRAATLPLAAPAQAAIAMMNQVAAPVSERFLRNLQPLCLHADDKVRLSIARLAAAHSEQSEVAYALSIGFIEEPTPAIQCHAAQGVLAPGRPLDRWSDAIFQPLARCLNPKIDSADAVERLLHRRPEVAERIALLHGNHRNEIRWSAALLLSFVHPEDSTLLGALLATGDSSRYNDSQCALVRAAQRSDDAVHWLLEQFAALSAEKSHRTGYSDAEVRKNVLTAAMAELFLLDASVRRQLLARLQPEAPFAVPYLEEWLAEMKREGIRTPKARLERAALIPHSLGDELLARLPQEPGELHLRIASLLSRIAAPPQQIAQALLPCMTAEPFLQLSAIKLAQENRLDEAEACGWLHTLGSPSRERWHQAHVALLRLARQEGAQAVIREAMSTRMASPHAAERLTAILVLHQEKLLTDDELIGGLKPYLQAEQVWLRWSAAAPLSRHWDKLPENLQILVVALWQGQKALKWPRAEDPPASSGRGWALPDREPRSASVPRDSSPATLCEQRLTTWVLEDAPLLGILLSACTSYLQDAVREGASMETSYGFDTANWFRRALLQENDQMAELLGALGSDEEAAHAVAESLLQEAVSHLSAPSSFAPGFTPVSPDELIPKLLQSARTAGFVARVELIRLLRWHGSMQQERTQEEVRLLLADESTPIQVKLDLLDTSTELSGAEAYAALAEGLQVAEPGLRYYAAALCHERLPGVFSLRAALLPCLADAAPPTVRLHAVALLALLPDFQPTEVGPALLSCLDTAAMASFYNYQLFSDAIEKHSEHRTNYRIFHSDGAWLPHLAALLLWAFTLEPQTLGQIATGWLQRSTAALLAKRRTEGSSHRRARSSRIDPDPYAEQQLALQMLADLGAVSDELDAALVQILQNNQWMEFSQAIKQMGRDSEIVLRALVPWCLDRHHRGLGNREWLTERARTHRESRIRLCQALRACMTNSVVSIAYESAAWLSEFGPLDDTAAQQFVQISRSPDVSTFWIKNRPEVFIYNSRVVEGLITALRDEDPHVCFRIWELLLQGDEFIPLAVQFRTHLIDALRSWLVHKDWYLRVEGIRELRKLDHIDPMEDEILRAGLHLRLDWEGASYATAVRFHAAQLLAECQPMPVAEEELFAALQPVLTLADPYQDENRRTLQFLHGLPRCRAQALRTYGEFLAQFSPRRPFYWESLELWLSLGGDVQHALRLALRYFADTHADDPEHALWLLLHPQLSEEARKKLDQAQQQLAADADPAEIPPTGGIGTFPGARSGPAAEAATRRRELLHSIGGRARLLAESPLPEAVLTLLTEAITTSPGVPEPFSNEPPTAGTDAFERLVDQVHHREHDTPTAQLARWVLLFRCFPEAIAHDERWLRLHSARSLLL